MESTLRRCALALLLAVLTAIGCRDEADEWDAAEWTSKPQATPALSNEEMTRPVETTFAAGASTVTMTVTYPLMVGGIYETPEREKILSVLKDGMTVVDVGAHVGYYAVPLAKAVPNGKVIAIEPADANYRLLTENAERNGCRNIVALKVAAGDRTASLTLFLDSGNTGSHSLAEKNRQTSGGTEVVPVDPLDTLLASERRIDVMKIDIQGAEFAALRGARAILERDHPALLVEYWPSGLKAFGEEPAEMLKFLESLGYAMESYSFTKRQWLPTSAAELNKVLTGTSFRNLWLEAKGSR
jgi:FkbM family methyltransferase